jgi:peptidoglycan/xylan/chitin deacetylase (PgdA/CDA1 family)
MQHVRDHYDVVSLEDLLAAQRGVADLPPRPVLVTFDDGEKSVLHRGVPVLRRYSVPAAVFVVAGALDGDGPFWWMEVVSLLAAGARSGRLPETSGSDLVRRLKEVDDDERLQVLAELRDAVEAPQTPVTHIDRQELRELIDNGVAIGNHSMSHPCLTRCSDEKVLAEIEQSHQILTDELGSPPAAFAYPNGDADARVNAALASRGYQLGFLFDHRVASMPIDTPSLAVSRLRVDSTTPIDRYVSILSGVHPAIHHVRGRR